MRPKETPEQKAMNRELARKAWDKFYGKTNPILEEIKRRTKGMPSKVQKEGKNA